jgi:two-component system sensor histidine kinase DegS
MDTDPGKAREWLKDLKTSAGSTFGHVRDFIFELRPMMLDDLGLTPTVRRYVEAYKERTALDINLVLTGKERRLESHIEVLIFRALQELLGNVREHAQATHVKVTLDMDTHQIRASVEDNGRGFEAESAAFAEGPGRGLKTLQERIGLVGGGFEVSTSPGKGSRIAFTVPTGE